MKHNIITGEGPDALTNQKWTMIDGTTPPTEAQLQAHGWRDFPEKPELAAGCARVSCKPVEGDGVTGAWEVVDRLTSEIEAEAAAAEQARINGLAWKFGGLVGALAAYLARVGWAIPCEAEVVTADLLQRDLGGQLTPDQKDAKANVADTHMMLREAGISNADIAAIWERVKP
jgi:hypothetical protein